MDIFKNKYYKVFPLSIFITKCTEGTVTFNEIGNIEIYKGEIELSGENLVLVNFDLLCSNGKGFIISKKINSDNLLGIDNYLFYDEGFLKSDYKKYDLTELNNSLKNYSCTGNSEKDENDKEVNDNTENFISNHKYKFHYYKKLDFTNLKFTLNDVDFKFTFKEKYNEGHLYNFVKNYKKVKGTTNYYDIIKEIIKNICSNYNKNYILKKINTKVLDKNNDGNNKNAYIEFLACLLNGENLTIDLGYEIDIKDVLLNDDLSKIYKIENSKKEEIIALLNGEYEEKNYLSLQEKLNQSENFKNITIENGNTNNYIENLGDVKITIIEDKGEGEGKFIVPKQCTIKFKAGNNLFITDIKNYPATKSINFSEDEGGITTETDITDYINENYKGIKDECIITSTNGESGKFEDGTGVTVTINAEIPGITSVKDINKVYVNVKFKVSDDSKFRFKGSLATTKEFSFILEKDKEISDLLTEIKGKLGNNDLEDGYQIEVDNNIINTDGTKLVDEATYTITLADNDNNFVEKIKKDKSDDKDKDSSNKNNNTKKGKNCCGSNKKNKENDNKNNKKSGKGCC